MGGGVSLFYKGKAYQLNTFLKSQKMRVFCIVRKPSCHSLDSSMFEMVLIIMIKTFNQYKYISFFNSFIIDFMIYINFNIVNMFFNFSIFILLSWYS